MTVASQLISEVKVTGADTSAAQLAAMGAASDASAASLALVEEASVGTSATLLTMGETMRAAGVEFFDFDAATSQFVSNMAEVAPMTDVATASTAAWQSATEMAAMTAEGMTAALDTETAAVDVQGAAMRAAIPSVASLNAQFSMMQARMATVSAEADRQGAAMLRNKVAHEQFGKALQGIGNVAKDVIVTLGKIALVTGAIAAVIGIVATKAAADFQQGLNRLVTGAGDVTDNMQKMGQAILGISADTGVLTGPLLSAMYQIISANQRGAQAENTLAVAAKGAIVEQANIVDVAKAITTAMTDYVNVHLTATQAMNGYTRATQLGKVTLEELSTALSPLLPITANMRIHFADVAAAMSTMTNAGLPAERAATSLRFLFQSLENPTKKASTAMVEWGLNSVKLADTMKVSLPKALQMVYDAAKKAGPEGSVPFNRAVSDMIGGQRSLQAFLSLTGSHMKTFEDDTRKIAAAMGISKDAVLGWDVAQKNFNVQLDRAKAAFMGLLITIGNMLLPKLTELLANIAPLVKGFTDWISHGDNLKNTLKTVGDVLAPLVSAIKDTWTEIQPLVQQFIQWAIKNDAAGKSLAIVKGIVLLFADTLRFLVPIIISVTVEIIKFISTLIDRLQPAIQGAVTFIQTHWQQIAAITQGIWSTISGIVMIAWNIIKGIILVGIDVLSGQWGKAGKDMQDAWNGVWEGIKRVVIGAMKTVLGVLALLPGGLGDMAKRALRELDKLTGGITNATDHIKKSAIQMQQAVVSHLQATVTSISTQLDNATSNSQRHFLQMKLDAAKQTLALQQAVLKNMQDMAKGVNKHTGTMDTDATKNAAAMKKHVLAKLMELNNDAVGHSIIPDMVRSITRWFTNMASSALSWGSSLINNFKSGLQSAWNAVVSWVNGALSWLSGQFPHSPVKEGPLKGSEKWGYNFMKNIADGMRAGMPEVQSALAGLSGGMGTLGVSHSFSGPSVTPTFFGGGGGGGITIVHVHPVVQPNDLYVDGRKFTDQVVGPHLARHWRQQTGNRRPT
jgi:TP901 family phage tail tape measure protein